MAKKNQSSRLTNQHKASKGVVGIFGDEARTHDSAVGTISHLVKYELEQKYPKLEFRFRKSISKKEINDSLSKIVSWVRLYSIIMLILYLMVVLLK